MAAAEERGAPAPHSYVGHSVRVQHAAPVEGGYRETRGVLVDVSTLGAEVVSGGERHFVPWAGVLRMTLVEETDG